MRTKLAFISLIALLAVFTYAAPAKADTGNINVTGTLVTLSGTTAPATLTLTAGATTYTVEISTTTKLVRKFGGASDLTELLVGDSLQVIGKLSDTTNNIISATTIKDLSLQRNGGTLHGNIVTLDCTANTFTFLPTGKNKTQQTVYLSSGTKIIRGGEKVKCSALKNGEQAIVIGTLRTAANRVDASRVIVFMKSVPGTITNITLTNSGLPAVLTVKHANGHIWTINVASSTKLFRRFMKTATIDEFAVGDKVETRGTVGTGRVLNAVVIRDNSITAKNKDYKGIIKSIEATAKSFTLTIGKTVGKKASTTDITVTTSTGTKYVKEDGTLTFADLLVGNRVKVLGVYNATTKILAATRIILQD